MAHPLRIEKVVVALLIVLSSAYSVDAREPTLKPSHTDTRQSPNVLLILADDLGYSDIGAFGGEIPTPNLDALAEKGVMLTNFHTSPACAPTRAMLMTGAYNHTVGLGKMVEYMRLVAPEYLGLPGYEGFLTKRARTLPELLREAGYRTYMAGKWHLGLDEDTSPRARGFDRSYAMLEGASGHFDDQQQVPGTGRKNVLFREDGRLVRPGSDFYSSKSYADKIIQYLETDRDDERPFFAYLAFTAPHWPLQAPAESIARHDGRYDLGYDQFFQQRLERQKDLGLVRADFDGHPTPPGYRDWDSLSAAEQRYSAGIMEIYAAMIEDMDIHIGRVLAKLRELGSLENTLVLFFSDNGATGGDHVQLAPFRELIQDCCDNSYENLGNANSYLVLGDEWARVSSGANKYYKGYTTQGGILSPAILSFPSRQSGPGRYEGFLTVMDVMPTLLYFAGIDPNLSARADSHSVQIRGVSFAPAVTGSTSPTHGPDKAVGWEWNNHRALWIGSMKLVMSQPPLGDGTWQLFDMSSDRHETRDLAPEKPALLQSMIDSWDAYAKENGVILAPPSSLSH